jgi:multicomponent Na+:H+ antiporter subunit C
MEWLGHFNYWIAILLMSAGLYAVIGAGNLIKKLIGLAIFQTSVLLFYISMGYVEGGRFPILEKEAALYINPLPHVLMLTAIVVGVATFAVGLALAVRIREIYGSVEEEDILAMDERPAPMHGRKRAMKPAPAVAAPKPPVRKRPEQKMPKRKTASRRASRKRGR